MPEKDKQYDAVEKVERMNRVFDHVVLPAIAFTVVMFIITAVMLKPSCGTSKPEQDSEQVGTGVQQKLDAYLVREVLLDDMEKNRGIFEQGGYTVVETEQSGLVAHRQIDENTEVFDNITDGSGNRYSAVMYENDTVSVTVRIYSERIFLVETKKDNGVLSAVFRDEKFSQWTSGSDADAGSIIELVTSEKLTALVEMYKQNILSLVDAG